MVVVDPGCVGRRAEVVGVSDFADLEFRWAVKALKVLNMGIMHGGQSAIHDGHQDFARPDPSRLRPTQRPPAA